MGAQVLRLMAGFSAASGEAHDKRDEAKGAAHRRQLKPRQARMRRLNKNNSTRRRGGVRTGRVRNWTLFLSLEFSAPPSPPFSLFPSFKRARLLIYVSYLGVCVCGCARPTCGEAACAASSASAA